MPDVDLAPDDGPGDEEARQFILQVKKIIERCLEQGMNKAEMFRVIREEGLPTWIAFAVFKELREQNHDFFKEYYTMHDVKRQREKLGRLIQAHRAGSGNAAAGARALETATMAAAAAMEPDTTAGMEEWSDQQAAKHASLEGELARLLAGSTGGGDQFAGAAASPQRQAVVHCPGGQQPHDDQQAVYNEWLREMTASAEEAVAMPVSTLAGQQLHDNDLPVANGMFRGVAWPQQAAAELPAAGQQMQLQHQQEQTGKLLSEQQMQQPYFPVDYQLQYQPEQAGQLPARQQLHYQEQDLQAWLQQDFPARQQLHCQQQDLQAWLQLHYQYQDQLMANGGGFHVAPRTLSAGLPSNSVMDPWPLSQDGMGWGQEQQAEPPRQRWPGAGADPSPSSTLPGGDQQLGNQNLHGSSAGSILEHPQ
ncbi:unnamed protein product [Urochloa humidicola]